MNGNAKRIQLDAQQSHVSLTESWLGNPDAIDSEWLQA